MKLRCENAYCVYNRDCECQLEQVEINETGCCDACTFIDVPKIVLDKYKDITLSRWGD